MNTDGSKDCGSCRFEALGVVGPCRGCYSANADTFQNFVEKTAEDLTPDERACLAGGGTVLGRDAKSWGVGMRFNGGKPPVWRGFFNYFPKAIRAVAEVSGFGASKYDWNNWQMLEDGYTNCSDSLARHLENEAEKGRLSKDVDSNLLDAAHSAWNAMARLEHLLNEEARNAIDSSPTVSN